MVPNPYDPRDRTDLTEREKIALEFTGGVLHGDDLHLIDKYVADDYIQHTDGIGQGPQGLRNFIDTITSKRPRRREWRPIHVLGSGDFVVLHKLMPFTVIADFFRFNADNKLVEHWDVVQSLPTPDYDPMRLSTEKFDRFYALFNMPPPANA